jgi:hypothetical protein
MAVRRYRPVNYPQTGGGASAWGSITGTLADQTDLQSALDLKADNTNVANWDTAFGWGNHASAGYLSSTGIGDIAFSASLGDRISLYDNRLDATNMYGFGVESGCLYSKAVNTHRWYINVNADTGTSDTMELDSTGLTVNGTIDATGGGSANWNTAFGWGDHSTEGYLTASSPQQYVIYQDLTASSNEDNWIIKNEIGTIKLATATDAAPSSVATAVITCTRVGTTPGTLTLNATTACTGSLSVTGAVTGSNLNVANWDTAYTYSQVGHLPLAGGTMTGTITLDESEVQGMLKSSANGSFWRGGYPSIGTTYSAAAAYIANNAYVDPGDTVSNQYRTSITHGSYGHTIYQMAGGIHTWYGNNDSVTANAVVTKVQQMQLSAAGALSVTGAVTGSNLNVSNWDTAYGWGDHGAAGYQSALSFNASGNWFGQHVPIVSSAGVLEVGRYMDWHATDASVADYDYRMSLTSGVMLFSGSIDASGYVETTGADTAPAAGASRLSANMLHIDGKEAIDGNDGYLRLNQNGDFTSGIHVSTGQVWFASTFRVDGTATFNGNIVGDGASTITGIEDITVDSTGDIKKTSHGNYLYHASSAYDNDQNGQITFSTSSASAGTTGDIWFTYT